MCIRDKNKCVSRLLTLGVGGRIDASPVYKSPRNPKARRLPAMRIVLVDDHTLFRMGVRHVLTNTPGHEVVGEASTARSAFRIVDALAPDIVLMDIAMPGMDGVLATREICLLYTSPSPPRL